MILRLTRQQLTHLESEAKKSSPIEACALLFGKIAQKEINVERVVMTPNVLQSTTRFEIDPGAFYSAFTAAEKNGLAFLGFFHSHPAPASPSSVDLHFMRLWGDAVWLIYSLTENRFAAFMMKKRRALPLILEVEEKNLGVVAR